MSDVVVMRKKDKSNRMFAKQLIYWFNIAVYELAFFIKFGGFRMVSQDFNTFITYYVSSFTEVLALKRIKYLTYLLQNHEISVIMYMIVV